MFVSTFQAPITYFLMPYKREVYTVTFALTMIPRTLARSVLRTTTTSTQRRRLHRTSTRLNVPTSLNNILAGGEAPSVVIKTVSQDGIELAGGLTIPSACIFLEEKTFLWDVPQTLWDKWTPEHFEIFDVVVPKPGELNTVYP